MSKATKSTTLTKLPTNSTIANINGKDPSKEELNEQLLIQNQISHMQEELNGKLELMKSANKKTHLNHQMNPLAEVEQHTSTEE